MADNSCILFGPKDDSGIPQESMGKYFYDCLRKADPAQVLNINAVTKEFVTYGQLLEDSIKLASIFKSLSIDKGDAIAIASENSIHYLTVVLAALYLGVVVNPLNPAYTPEELKHALLISKPKFVLCSETALQTVLKIKPELQFMETVMLMGQSHPNNSGISCLEELIKQTKVDTDSFQPYDFDHEQGAFIFLSSGTTGLPKGVLLSHKNLRSSVVYMTHPNYGGAAANHTTLLIVPFFHIYGIIIEAAALVTSMQVVVFEKFKPDLVLNCIQTHRASKLYLVPSIVNFLANSPLVDNYDMSSIEDILCGTASLADGLLKKALKRLGCPSIRQGYGLTEVTGACMFQIPGDIRTGSVGTLVPEAVGKVWDFDTCGNAGPLKSGELCFKGPMLMKGYLENGGEVKTCIDEEGFYHSGDLGYYDEYNHFYIVDRLKELIKYKGFQVPPAELEALLLTHPEITDCGVVGIADDRAGELPLAFVVLQSGSKLSEKDVVQYVAERISIEKQLHGGVRFVDEIPKTASGKILRRVLLEQFKTII